MHSV
jgi:hypothetical protein